MPELPCDTSVHVVNSTHFVMWVQSIALLVSIYSVLKFKFRLSRLRLSFLDLGKGTVSFFLLISPSTMPKPKLGCSLPDHKHECLIFTTPPKPKKLGRRIITINTKSTILDLAKYKVTKHVH